MRPISGQMRPISGQMRLITVKYRLITVKYRLITVKYSQIQSNSVKFSHLLTFSVIYRHFQSFTDISSHLQTFLVISVFSCQKVTPDPHCFKDTTIWLGNPVKQSKSLFYWFIYPRNIDLCPCLWLFYDYFSHFP